MSTLALGAGCNSKTTFEEHTMQSYQLYDLARLQQEELRRLSRTAYLRYETPDAEVTDVPARHRRWRLRWQRHPRPVTA